MTTLDPPLAPTVIRRKRKHFASPLENARAKPPLEHSNGIRHRARKSLYKLGLARLYDRMDKVDAEYGCLITEGKCVVQIQKTDIVTPDMMEVSEGIAWGVSETELYSRLTVWVALWGCLLRSLI